MKRYTAYFKSYLSMAFAIFFSFVWAEKNDSLQVNNLTSTSSTTTIYIVKGTKTNLLDIAKIESKKTSKKVGIAKKSIKQKKKQDYNQPKKEAGEKVKKRESKQDILNQPVSKYLILSGFYKKSFTIPAGSKLFKIITEQNQVKLLTINDMSRKIIFCSSIYKAENLFQNITFSRPPPSLV